MAKVNIELDLYDDKQLIDIINNHNGIMALLFDLKYNVFRSLIDHNDDENISAETMCAYETAKAKILNLINEYNLDHFIE